MMSKTMPKLACVLLLTPMLFGQAKTPNIGLYIPGHNSQQWDIPLNQNFSLIDQYLSGLRPIPALQVTNWLTFGSTTVAGLSSLTVAPFTQVGVTDGASQTDCTTGGGSFRVNCWWNGTVWAPFIASGTFSAGGDLSGTSSSQTVVGILGAALPSLSTGVLSYSGGWHFGALTCASLSDAKPSCSTDTTNASNISSGVLNLPVNGALNGTLGQTTPNIATVTSLNTTTGGLSVGGTTVVDSSRNGIFALLKSVNGLQVNSVTAIDINRNALLSIVNANQYQSNGTLVIDSARNFTGLAVSGSSGAFSGTVTSAGGFFGNLNGNASTASNATSAAQINGVAFPANAQQIGSNGSGQPLAITTTKAIEYVIDGGGSAITTGLKGWVEIPFNCTISAWSLVADQSGSATVDILATSYAGIPSAGSITGGNPPTMSGVKGTGAPSGWTTAVAAGTWIEYNVTAASTITRVTVSIRVTVP